MAENNGYQQSIYAGKFSSKGTAALDKDGNFCSESGKKQAILLLEGSTNPDPSKYEVVGSFKEGDIIDGHPSMVYNTVACPLPEPEPVIPPYIQYPKSTIFVEFSNYNNNLGNWHMTPHDWDYKPTDTQWNSSSNRQTMQTIRIGEYEWTRQNLSMLWEKDWVRYNVNQESIDKYQGETQTPQKLEDFWYECGCMMNGNTQVDIYLGYALFYNNKFERKEVSGWRRPTALDFTQLLSMADDMSYDSIVKFIGLKRNNPADVIDAINESGSTYKHSLIYKYEGLEGEDISGFHGIPTGSKQNEETGLWNSFRQGYSFKFDYAQGNCLRITDNRKIILDPEGSPVPASLKFWLHSQRFCRALTDEELGYKLYIDETNDKIVIAKYPGTQPTNLSEIPKGRLRGRAVRWMNEDQTKILSSLSKLREEVATSNSHGKYAWDGFDTIV